MVIMPLTGMLMTLFFARPLPFFGLFEIPSPVDMNKDIGLFFKESHEIIAWAFIILITLHGLAALYHHFILKDNTLKRMTRGQ
jgi:cytochrome b561